VDSSRRLIGHPTLVTGPEAEPITLAEAKAHCRVDHADDNDFLVLTIQAARMWWEETYGRALLPQTWDYSMNTFPRSKVIHLPWAPLRSVTSITYYSEDLSTSTVFPSSSYQVDTGTTPGRVALKENELWPTDELRVSSGVVIRFVAGYNNAEAVPGPIKSALKLLVAQMYAFREPQVTGTIVTSVAFAVEALSQPYKVWWF